jgi:peptidoglycan/LPS O-acetylase OafA/YrhL
MSSFFQRPDARSIQNDFEKLHYQITKAAPHFSRAHITRFSYRPDIDGLRAIAVLAVVLFHARLGISGGYVGVDVFFVISGFLITLIILKDIERKSFSIITFWERRIKRIFPALMTVVICTTIAG